MKRILVILVMFVAMNANAQWQPDVRLTNNMNNSSTSFNNAYCVAASGNFVHVIWFDDRDGNYEIYYKRSTNGGTTWGTDTRLTNNTSVSDYPTLCVSGAYVHIVWEDYRDGNWEIYYKRSTDSGISWEADTRLTNYILESFTPSLSISGQILHVVWEDKRDGNMEIYYKRSTDGGTSWGTDTRLTNNTYSSLAPSIAVSSQVIHIVWVDLTEIYYKCSTNNGISWGADIRLTNNIAISNNPSVSVSGQVVHVVWEDLRDGNYEVYYKRSTNDGIMWEADTRLTIDSGYSVISSVTAIGSTVHIVWRDYRDGNDEIYYKRSIDGGLSWNADTRLTNNSASSFTPSLAISGQVVHVVWQDNRDGNKEIYYKRNPTGNITDIENIVSETPSKYSLSQNYPNPFNPTTNIKFSIVNSGDVKLVVYDIQGREVQTLVNESLKPGTYEAAFDGSALNSGVYFYKLVTGNFTETKKMLLIK